MASFDKVLAFLEAKRSFAESMGECYPDLFLDTVIADFKKEFSNDKDEQGS